MNLLPSTSCLWVPVPCQVLAEVTTLQALQETTIDGLEIDMEGWCVIVRSMLAGLWGFYGFPSVSTLHGRSEQS